MQINKSVIVLNNFTWLLRWNATHWSSFWHCNSQPLRGKYSHSGLQNWDKLFYWPPHHWFESVCPDESVLVRFHNSLISWRQLRHFSDITWPLSMFVLWSSCMHACILYLNLLLFLCFVYYLPATLKEIQIVAFSVVICKIYIKTNLLCQLCDS